MKSRLKALTAGLLFAVGGGLAACNDPNDISLSPVIADTLTLWALSGTSPSFPSGYLASSGAITRADGGFNFDIAFDIDPTNKIVVYPQRLVGVPLGGPKPVGLQRITTSFDQLTRAPSSGYVFDSTFTVTPGQGLVMQVQSSNECLAFISSVRYTKFVVDSIDAARRLIYFRAVHDPNCGYRTLVAGSVPKN
jgi:hypothetical protein